jgi:hypothetical protein
MTVRYQSGDEEVIRLKEVQRMKKRKSSFFRKISVENAGKEE